MSIILLWPFALAIKKWNSVIEIHFLAYDLISVFMDVVGF